MIPQIETPNDNHQSSRRYFVEFLATKLHQPLLPKLQKLSVAVRIALLGASRQTWVLTLKNGMLESISQDGAAQCGFVLDTATFLAIAAGRLSPQFAFFQRRIEIEGDVALGLRLATVLADFFRRFPYEAPDA